MLSSNTQRRSRHIALLPAPYERLAGRREVSFGVKFGHDGMPALSPFYPQLRTVVDAAGHGSFVLIRGIAIGLPHLMPKRVRPVRTAAPCEAHQAIPRCVTRRPETRCEQLAPPKQRTVPAEAPRRSCYYGRRQASVGGAHDTYAARVRGCASSRSEPGRL